ncbi:methyltransferase domain-containing protein [Candidatus Uhrbacteria bacterium]|nr:methyltransferase domain-containing protein [Candidatus Uhrbacteria bacterium]
MKNRKENYARFYSGSQELSYGKPARIVELIPQYLHAGTVLDLGAGDGRHALFLAARGFTVTALDTSDVALDKLQRLAKEKSLAVTTETMDVTKWKFDQEYDAIIATVILQHLSTKDALRILEEMKQHTRAEGVHALSVFTNHGDRYLMDREEDPEAFYPKNGWLKEYYQDWEILDYAESKVPLLGKTRPDGSPMMNVTARMLARKPKL